MRLARAMSTASAIDTPALLVRQSALTANRRAMASIMAKYAGVGLRPHVKAHKAGR